MKARARTLLAVPRLPLARYRFRFRGCPPAGGHPRPPCGGAAASPLRGGYLGSAWRGAFGSALRKTVCVTRLPACDPCVLLRSCPYPFLFESRPPPGAGKLAKYTRTPGPYVLEPADRRVDSEAESTNLGVTLFGRANGHLPYVLHALERAGRRGITSKWVALELLEVQVEARLFDAGEVGGTGEADRSGKAGEAGPGDWITVFTPEGGLKPPAAVHPRLPPVPARVGVRLVSPLRLRRRDHLVAPSGFDFHAFLSGLLRRISLLTYFYSDRPLETDFAALLRRAKSVPLASGHLDWRPWTRYSSRQKAKLRMDGIVGRFELEGAGLEPFWPYLWLGQWTHAGKGTSMGLGRFVLEAGGGDGPTGNDGKRWAGPAPL